MTLKKLATARSDIFQVDPDLINVKKGWNVRLKTRELDEHIDQLALSISQVGVQEPLSVIMEDHKIFLTNGHCRLKAIERANRIILIRKDLVRLTE